MTLQENLHKLGLAIKRHAPEILTSVSVAGLGATAYLGSRAGFKSGLVAMADAAARIDAAEDEDEEISFMTPKELIKETWKFYIPVAVVGVATAVAIIGSNRVSNNRQLALISAAAISEQALRDYQAKIVEATSKPKERKIQDDIAQDKITDKKEELDRLLVNVGDGDVLCMEMYTGRVFISTAEKIHKAENMIGRQCIQDDYASHNDFMTLLGLPWVDAGDAVGWNNDNPLEVVIGGGVHENKNSGRTEPVLSVGYVRPPKVGYSSPW